MSCWLYALQEIKVKSQVITVKGSGVEFWWELWNLTLKPWGGGGGGLN